MQINAANLLREFVSQFFLCIFIALAAPQSSLWPLFVFGAWPAFRGAFSSTAVHTTTTLSSVIIDGNYGNLCQTLVDILAQFAGAILAGWVSFVVVESSETAPVATEGAGVGFCLIILGVVTGFHAHLRKGAGDNFLSAGLLWTATVFAIQGFLPGAIGNINTDVGRVIGAQIYGSGDMPSLNFDSTWVFIVGPILGLLGAKIYMMAEGALDGVDCGGAGDSGGKAAPVSQNANVPSAMPMVSPQQHHHVQHYAGSPIHGSIPAGAHWVQQ